MMDVGALLTNIANVSKDGTTEVLVMAQDKPPEAGKDVKDDGLHLESEATTLTQRAGVQGCDITSSSRSTPRSLHLPGNHLPGGVTARGAGYYPRSVDDFSSQRTLFSEPRGLGVSGSMPISNPNGNLGVEAVVESQNGGERQSLFHDYSTTNNDAYGQSWRNSSDTSPTLNVYGYNAQPGIQVAAPFELQLIPMNMNDSLMSGSFEGSPRTPYAGSPSTTFQLPELLEPTLTGPEYESFPTYFARDTRTIRELPIGLSSRRSADQ